MFKVTQTVTVAVYEVSSIYGGLCSEAV